MRLATRRDPTDIDIEIEIELDEQDLEEITEARDTLESLAASGERPAARPSSVPPPLPRPRHPFARRTS